MSYKLDELIREGYVTQRQHPTLGDISILNYTNKAQYERKWNDITLRCRGLMMYKDTLISNPFPKFFNLGETNIESLPKEPPIVTVKVDGSLIIVQPYDNKLLIATRGSFTSDMALHAKELITSKGLDFISFNPAYTYLFEIIYPQNRIVVDYGIKDELVLIGVRHIVTGKEDISLLAEGNRLGFSCAPSITSTLEGLIPMAKTLKGTEDEGFVIHYPSSGLRIKIKAPDYLRLHKLITNCSDFRVLQAMKVGTLNELIDNVPDEFYVQVQQSIKSINDEKKSILRLAHKVHTKVKDLPTRKEQAIELNTRCDKRWLKNIVYALLDGRPQQTLDSIVYNLINRKHIKW